MIRTADLRKTITPDTTKPLSFQVIDIADCDAFPQIPKDELGEIMAEAHEGGVSFKTLRNQRFPKKYQMMLSGVNGEGVPVTLSVGGFHPFFYIQVPETDRDGRLTLQQIDIIRKCEIKGFKINRQEISMDEFLLRIQRKAMRTFDEEEDGFDEETEEIIRQELENGKSSGSGGATALLRSQLAGLIWPPKMEMRKDLYWYKGEGVKERYYRLEFQTKVSFFAWRKMVLDTKNYPMTILPDPKTKRGPFRFNIYEANLEPSLRFIHATGIPACGWVTIPAGSWDIVQTHSGDGDGEGSESDAESVGEVTMIHAECDDYKALGPAEEQGSASLLIASFDIESDSSHGDFPLAKKKWERIISVLAQNPSLTSNAATMALREAIKGRRADVSKTEPFGPIYFKRPIVNPTSAAILAWLTPELITEVAKLSKKSPEEAQTLLLSKAPKDIGEVEGDPIIQIGTTFHRDGKIVSKHIITLGSCNPAGVPDTEVIPVSKEEDVIREWVELIELTNPDIITGYNITFFDMAYIRDRAEELHVLDLIENPKLARFPGTRSRYHMMRLSSAAMGDNFLKTIEMPGRVILDLCAAVRRNFTNLDSYKLDNVAQAFLFGEIKTATLCADSSRCVEITTKSTFGLTKGGFIHVCDEEGEDIGGKLPIREITPTMVTIEVPDDEDAVEVIEHGARWTQAKDDVPPSEIFRLQKGTADDRAIVAKYCVQDCVLVLDLLQKLDIVPNAIAMGTVCSVPMSYIFFRGQTIKLSSLVYRECEKAGLIVPVLSSPTRKEMNDSYEGAVVLEPRVGLYLDCPVAVFDYGSLYPSSMMAENISHDTIVAIWDRDNEGRVVEIKGDPELAGELPKDKYVDITFDRFEPDPADTRKVPEKVKVGTRTCRYVQYDGDRKGIVGEILRELLRMRKVSKKRMEAETDPFKKGLLNSLQLAYKVTANSLYGALGAKNCKIRFQDLAASTTATGRKMLNYAREAIERLYGRGARPDCDAKYVYGDTDSVFVMFQPKYPDGTLMKGRDARVKSLELAKEAEKVLSEPLRAPQTLNYEKIFDPFMLFSKKRYIGMKYEEDPDKCKQANMGVVLKRRDNAPIVKEIYQAVVDTIMKDRDLSKSVSVAREILRRLVDGKVSLKKLTITKSLRAEYANPDQIAHKVLAERIGDRDPGNKPKANDRIAFIYFDSTKTRETKKQGDRIETPEYMVAHNLRPDYTHYITNQIQKPLTQLFRLFWSQVAESSPSVKESRLRMLKAQARQDPRNTPEKIETMLERAIDGDIEKIIFAPSVRASIGGRVGPMDAFLKGMKVTPRKS